MITPSARHCLAALERASLSVGTQPGQWPCAPKHCARVRIPVPR